MTGCGETSERVAAVVHGAVAALYLVMLIFHVKSTIIHASRECRG